MAHDYIQPEHISYLLLKHTNAKTKEHVEQLRRHLRVSDPATRAQLFAFLDSQAPGTSARLERVWFFSGQRTIQLWKVPLLSGFDSPTKLLARRNLSALATQPGLHAVGDNTLGQDRVSKIGVDADRGIVVARVVLYQTRSWEVEEEETQQFPGIQKVPLRIHLGYETPIVEVHSTIQSARKALFIFLEWLLEAPVPRRKSREQEAAFSHFTFTEADIKLFSEKRSYVVDVLLDGDDATGDVGEHQLRGKKVGALREPLNMNSKRVLAQYDAENESRTYNVHVQHSEDGFTEIAEVEFNFASSPPHIKFNRAASRTMVDFLIDELYTTIGRAKRR